MWPLINKFKRSVDLMNLYVDDERQLPDEGWKIATSSQDAIKILAKGKIDGLSLDHDLGEEAPGTLITKWLVTQARAKKYKLIPNDIFLHTSNPVGRENMTGDLTDLAKVLTQAGFDAVCTAHGIPVFHWDPHAS